MTLDCSRHSLPLRLVAVSANVGPYKATIDSMSKEKCEKNEKREERIMMEIIADAYGPEEQAIGWYYYLENQLEYPFTASCTAVRAISPLEIGDKVDVIGLPPEEECEKEMFVTIQHGKRGLAVPLSQLKVVHANSEKTIESVDDWRYWVAMGYQFG